MPKRKRSSYLPDDEISTSSDRLLNRQKTLCSQRIEKGQKALVQALKLGAGFERQKYSRRRKTATEKNDDKAVERLEKEYTVLKTLNLQKIAEQHLRKTIGRVKSIKDNEALPRSVREIEKGEQDMVRLNVLARLYKVQGVRRVVDAVIEDLKGILGVTIPLQHGNSAKGDIKDRANGKKVRKEKEDVDEYSGSEEEAFEGFDGRIAGPSSADEEDSDDELSEGHRPPSIAGSNYDSEKDSEEDSEHDSENSMPLMRYAPSEEDSDRSPEEESSSLEEQEYEDELSPPPETKRQRGSGLKEKPSTSTFLPSLSMGGYISGSESEASDLDDVAPKKNRRGQRARQAIWEQKYKDKAKHLQKAAKSRNAGWDTRKGAVDDSRERGSGKGAVRGMKGRGKGPEKSGGNAIELGPKKVTKRDDVGELHPSWQAAKAKKEMKIVAKPQGTKVVFD
ncbi:Bud-site selection protein [Zopfia rhizophila CBS 207.26]|uniref:Bud-site selection protein n=1 Tax=Zopfia rhizophila CBS 207.26 TaxID=1314779 RepID=A0A6A6ESX8_9PEZI|nr:Bud-site selection protein [Zopfia rhizophila CBS 207.26]